MATLMDLLEEKYGQQLRFEEGRVAWDKTLLLTLRKLGYDLKLEDYATRVILYKGDQRLGEIDYKVITIEDDEEMNDAYEVLLLDLSPFKV
ncbi:hypothetical protein CathTA2_2875 [Caldalkalibacillus thermarum TA2.A1]|uniref:Uncharacterized protein n=1 Tax=Caldalkalibacillus thermarum (strain TA2.A1) TaxID=986075 RepID=F5LAE0_CALTT|nr:hypothetical protein [Caldalkalibacillus thermarum]EGL81689.1 hypothetical protein CathTA2_2875 [Caldalkalibacillus thermarum TA2.A1]QZT33280.1 hypothetical protein HUR95_13440 [Caldalkalibacillus thermarum TA2.A1]GGK20298.1 hypothetical protein GCM10010965_11620 [Caldalkalibacillus thermarum]